jgi:hypothetical protein
VAIAVAIVLSEAVALVVSAAAGSSRHEIDGSTAVALVPPTTS